MAEQERTPKVLIVDDDPRLRDLLRRYLGDNGFSVSVADGAPAMNRIWMRERFDALILDLMLPGEDGLQILRRLRASKDMTPVLMLTARSELNDRVRGLDAGADDYLPKPFAANEFLARVRALTRRSNTYASFALSFGNVTLDCCQYLLKTAFEEVRLNNKEFQLTELFLRHPRQVFSSEHLMEKVWGVDYCGETRTVDMHIRTLRQKLGKAGAHITTVRGVGYRWEETI